MTGTGDDGPPPDSMSQVCDFCELPAAQRPPRWYYPTGEATVTGIGGALFGLDALLGNGWVACAQCRAFIDGDDYHGLAADIGYGISDELPTTLSVFRNSRLGPAQPYLPPA